MFCLRRPPRVQHFRPIVGSIRFKSTVKKPLSSSSEPPELQPAREHCQKLVKSDIAGVEIYNGSKSFPEPSRDALLAIRAFMFELNEPRKLPNGKEIITTKQKLDYWMYQLQKAFDTRKDFTGSEPVGVLLHHSLRKGVKLDLNLFNRFIRGSDQSLQSKTVEEALKASEETFSQRIYLGQMVCSSPELFPLTAHLVGNHERISQGLRETGSLLGQVSGLIHRMSIFEWGFRSFSRASVPLKSLDDRFLTEEEVSAYVSGGLDGDEAHKADVEKKLAKVGDDLRKIAEEKLWEAREVFREVQQESEAVINAFGREEEEKFAPHLKTERFKRGISYPMIIPLIDGVAASDKLAKFKKSDYDLLASGWRTNGTFTGMAFSFKSMNAVRKREF